MGSSISQAAGFPVTRQIGNLELCIGRVTLRTIARFETWCREQIVTRAKAALVGLPADLQAEMMREAVRESNRCSVATPVGQAMARSIEGAAQLLFLASVDHTKGLTVEKVLDGIALSDQEALDSLVSEALGAAPGSGSGSRSEPSASPL